MYNTRIKADQLLKLAHSTSQSIIPTNLNLTILLTGKPSFILCQPFPFNTPASLPEFRYHTCHHSFLCFCTTKYDLPISWQAIDYLHNKLKLVNLSVRQKPNAFACASGTGRVRGELGRPKSICFLSHSGSTVLSVTKTSVSIKFQQKMPIVWSITQLIGANAQFQMECI